MKSCLNPAATPGEPHSSASPQPTSPPPNNREQPANPHRVTLVLTPGPPTSSPMKEPPTPRPPNSRKHQKYMIRDLKLWPQTPKELVGTDHPASCPLDATLRNTTPTWINYAARTNLASPNPANEEGPTAFATSASIMARSRKTSVPPRQLHCQEDQSPEPAGHRERFEGPPSNTNMAHGPATNKRKPLHPWSEFPRIKLNSTAQNATELHRRTPATPAKPWEPSLRCPTPSRQTPGLASTVGTNGRNPRLWIH
ncbi:hypothetical protein E4T56_gene1187 [Termitomyces sp. T112]|nr:hypothetical protein E4T56_gene1187 [Termitomyces sp. T112]